MIRPLKVALIVWGVIHILLGLALIVAPHQTASMMGFAKVADAGVYTAALCGAAFIAASVWVIVAGLIHMSHGVILHIEYHGCRPGSFHTWRMRVPFKVIHPFLRV